MEMLSRSREESLQTDERRRITSIDAHRTNHCRHRKTRQERARGEMLRHIEQVEENVLSSRRPATESARNLPRRGGFHDQAGRSQLPRHLSEEPREEDRQRHRHDRQPHGARWRFRTAATATRPSATASPASTSPSSRPISPEEELEAECGAKLDIDEADVSVVLDDTMVQGRRAVGLARRAPDQREGREKAACSSSPGKCPRTCSSSSARSPTISAGDRSMATPVSPGLWVFKDDLTRERVLGAHCRRRSRHHQHRGRRSLSAGEDQASEHRAEAARAGLRRETRPNE